MKTEVIPPAWAKAYPNAWLRYLLREEEVIKPALERLEKAKANNPNRQKLQYEWKANYGDGEKMHNKDIEEEPNPKDLNYSGNEKTIFDKTEMKISPTDRVRIGMWEQGKMEYINNQKGIPNTYHIPLITWRWVILNHLAFKFIPFVFIMYWLQ